MKTKRSGAIMVFFLGLMALGLLFAVASLSFQGRVIRNAKMINVEQSATYVAEAGLEKGLSLFLADPSYTGSTVSVGTGSATITLAAGSSSNEKILSSVGTISGQTKRLRVKLTTQAGTGVAVAFRYALQAGSQGLTMGNNSTINGSIYSNQNIVAGNGSAITGDAAAVGTISSNVTVGGQRLSGQPAQPLATFDSAFWRSKAQAGSTITGDYTPADGALIGPLYVTGNLIFSNNVNVSIRGPVYAAGNVTFGNNVNLTIDSSLGNQGVMLVGDGAISFGNSLNVIRQSTAGYILVTSTSTSPTAINIGNGTAIVNAPLFAPNGGINIGNSAHALSFAGQQVALGTNAVVTYDTGLATASFTSGPGGTWTVNKGTYQEY